MLDPLLESEIPLVNESVYSYLSVGLSRPVVPFSIVRLQLERRAKEPKLFES